MKRRFSMGGQMSCAVGVRSALLLVLSMAALASSPVQAQLKEVKYDDLMQMDTTVRFKLAKFLSQSADTGPTAILQTYWVRYRDVHRETLSPEQLSVLNAHLALFDRGAGKEVAREFARLRPGAERAFGKVRAQQIFTITGMVRSPYLQVDSGAHIQPRTRADPSPGVGLHR